MKRRIIFVLITAVLAWITSVTIVKSQDFGTIIGVRDTITSVLENIPDDNFFSQSRQDRIDSRSQYWATVNLDEGVEEFTETWNELARSVLNNDERASIQGIPDFMLFQALLANEELASNFTRVVSNYSQIRQMQIDEVVRKWAAVRLYYPILWCIWPICW